MKILELYKEGYLEMVRKAAPDTKESIEEFFELLDKADESQNIAGLNELKKSEYNKILFLDLSEQKLKELPKQIELCTNLLAIDLSNNPITKFEGLDKCKSLNAVFIESSELTFIPNEIFYLKNLTSINLNNNNISNFETTVHEPLKFLTGVNLSSNRLKEIPKAFLGSLNLLNLSIENNRLESFDVDIAKSKKLYSLSIYNNPIRKIPAEIGELTNLKHLDIDQLEISSLPNTISNLNNLEAFICDNNNYLSQIPKHIFALKNLKSLQIGGDKIKFIPEEIGSLEKLEHLSLNIRNVEKLSSSIAKLNSLKSLRIYGNNRLVFPVNHVSLSELKGLHIYNCSINSFPGIFKGCRNLESVSVNNSEVKEIDENLPLLKKLKSLSLAHNEINILPIEIGKLYELTSLNLTNNELDSLPLETSNLRKLISLQIADNPFNEMPEIKEMGIDEIFSYFNKIRGIGDYILIWELPSEVRTAFQQYLNFFSEYFEKLENEPLEMRVLKIDKGLKIEIETSEKVDINKLNSYLKSYLELAKTDSFSRFTETTNDFELELFKLKLEGQVNHLQQQLKQVEFENKYLKGVVDKFFELQTKCIESRNISGSKSSYPTSVSDRIKKLIASGNLEEAIEILMRSLRKSESRLYNEVILINSKFSRILKEDKIGVIDRTEKESQLANVAKSLLSLAEEIK